MSQVEPASDQSATPAPEIIMAANGVYWRRYADSLSMVPTSDDNDPVLTPYAVYRLVGYEDHSGAFTALEDCPDCYGGRPKWAGTMPAPPCPTCAGTGQVSPHALTKSRTRWRTTMADSDVDRARMNLEDAVYKALEAGMTAQDVRDEVEYTLENTDDD